MRSVVSCFHSLHVVFFFLRLHLNPVYEFCLEKHESIDALVEGDVFYFILFYGHVLRTNSSRQLICSLIIILLQLRQMLIFIGQSDFIRLVASDHHLDKIFNQGWHQGYSTPWSLEWICLQIIIIIITLGRKRRRSRKGFYRSHFFQILKVP